MPLPRVRTSKTDPLQIASIKVPGGEGTIGLTLCPGKKDNSALTGAWDRDLKADIAAIRAWGAAAVVCLMEPVELKLLHVTGLPAAVKSAGMAWFHLPIRDVDIPSSAFETSWRTKGPKLRSMLAEGRRILIHCRGGLGRSGTIAGRLLIESGMNPEQAIALVRKQRPGAIETPAQEANVRKTRKPTAKTQAIPAASLSEDRAIGCLLGLAIGDALGTTLEFSARDSLPPVTEMIGGGPFRLKPGEWTDDTSMALCLADLLLECRQLDPTDLMRRFRDWRDRGHNSVTGRCFDIGITTSQAISRFVSDGNLLAGSTDPMSAGNGSIMRLAPVPIFYSADPAAAEAAVVLHSRTTHAAPECLDACRVMTRIITRLLAGAGWQEALDDLTINVQTPKIRALAAQKWRGKKRAEIKSTGYVVDTLEAALWAVDATETFSEAVLLAVNLGGDADTIGAVTGQLAGARHGYQGIPAKWTSSLAWSDKIRSIALSLAAGPDGLR